MNSNDRTSLSIGNDHSLALLQTTDSRTELARSLMDWFARATGIEGTAKPRRYLWTDAFAVCNFLSLNERTGDERYLELAVNLVDQVHHVLGRHRHDDSRKGWISGLSESEGEIHPTIGGLRIGKPLAERRCDQPFDSQLEWHRDGQYYHYLTKWIHALNKVGQATKDRRYHQWGTELAAVAFRAFSLGGSEECPPQLAWKMSIDLSHPLVSATGQHDALDGLVACLSLQTSASIKDRPDLDGIIADLARMCDSTKWGTNDPLGIGGLLDAAFRISGLILDRDLPLQPLLQELLREAEKSLAGFESTAPLSASAEERLAFRELGLAIGLHAVPDKVRKGSLDAASEELIKKLLPYRHLAGQIEAAWIDPVARSSSTWVAHEDINGVMLATALTPDNYLRL